MNKHIERFLSVMKVLAAHSWRGNVRELQNFMSAPVIWSRAPCDAAVANYRR